MEGNAFGPYQLIERLDEEHLRSSHPAVQVWKALDTVHDRAVVLRLMSAELSRDEEFIRWFRQRVTAAGRLNGLRTVTVHAHGLLEGRLFVVTELVDGQSLKTLLEGGPLHPWEALLLLQEVADVLDAIHQREPFQNDLKPANVLVTGRDSAYLDVVSVKSKAIGTSQSLVRTDPDAYQPEEYSYWAPERFTSDSTENAGPQSDVYSLACVLYECLTGSTPFASDSMEEVIGGHLAGVPSPPSNVRENLPAALDGVILKGLAKDPAERFASATELILAAKTALGSANEQSGRGSPSRLGEEHPGASIERARSAISDALFKRPRVVLVQASSEAEYVETVFPGLRPEAPVYVCDEETVSSRTSIRPGSPPPAFGIYQALVHPDFPFLAIRIVEGTGSVESTSLDEDLLAYYEGNGTDEHGQRLMTGLALMEPDAAIGTHQLSPGVGVVIPQLATRPPIVYRLNPEYGSDNVSGPHAYIRYRKFLVPRADGRAVDAARELGFAPWQPDG